MPKRNIAIFQAVMAAALFGMSTPVSKLLLDQIPPVMMAALLYLGAAIGMLVIYVIRGAGRYEVNEARITRHEAKFVVAMILLDIAAPILLMVGLRMSAASNVALLGNFEIVATAIIALVIFKENIGPRLWLAIGLITLSSILLSVKDLGNFSFSTGAILVLMASACWGLENNCTRMLSIKDPMQVVIIKGFGSGLGSLIIALAIKEFSFALPYIIAALVLGFFAYGLGIYLYVLAQRELGAARTSAYYAAAPFIGVGLSVLMFRQDYTVSFFIALAIMIIGAYLAAVEKHKHDHAHELLIHEHRHAHDEGHHNHHHDTEVTREHSHEHVHEPLIHVHSHTPDLHHQHNHTDVQHAHDHAEAKHTHDEEAMHTHDHKEANHSHDAQSKE
jgi:drug/metabolite transporter (DMT)-like permease